MAHCAGWSRLLAISGAVIAVSACSVPPPVGGERQTEVNRTEPSGQWFGGYLDVTLVPGLRLQDSRPPGKVTTVLSFIGSDPGDPCQPSWAGYYNLDQADDELGLGAQVENFRRAGNGIAVSFGGQLGTELAVSCTDADALAQAYSAVISRYALNVVDLDVEGKGLEDHAAAKRRAAAMRSLQAERATAAPLNVWLTLPVSTEGLTPHGETAVRTMLDAGVELAGVNIMTMNFGPLAAGQTMLDAAKSAAENTHRTLAVLFEKAGKPLEAAALWKKIGLTPMVGTNDVKGQVFTREDAEGLNRFALERGIGRVSMWSLNRDVGCSSSSGQQLPVVPSNDCSGVEQEPGMFAKLLANAYTG